MTSSSLNSARDDAGAGGNALAFAHRHVPFGSEQDIDTRSEFDESDALAFIDDVAGLFITDDAARDQASDLFEDDARAFAIDGHDVLFVGMAGGFFARYQELSFLIFDARDFSGDGRAVDVDVENVQEDADATCARRVRFHG